MQMYGKSTAPAPVGSKSSRPLRLRLIAGLLALTLLGAVQASPASADQGRGWVDVTIDITENAGWKSTTFYANPPLDSRVGCPDDKLSFFFRFSYMVYNGVVTIKDMRLTNGASRDDPIKAAWFTSGLDGDNSLTTTRMVNPGGRSYVYKSASSSARTVLTGTHTNGGGQNRYIEFDIASEWGGRSCGAAVIVRLK